MISAAVVDQIQVRRYRRASRGMASRVGNDNATFVPGHLVFRHAMLPRSRSAPCDSMLVLQGFFHLFLGIGHGRDLLLTGGISDGTHTAGLRLLFG